MHELGNKEHSGLDWLVQLRWCACLAHVAAALFASWGLGIHLPLLPSALTISALMISNLALGKAISLERVQSNSMVGFILIFDAILFSILLHYAGGHTNPFSAYLLVQVTLAAILLGTGWTWSVAIVCCVCFGMLFIIPNPNLHHSGSNHADSFALHLQGMWMAFLLSCVIIGYFLNRISRELRDKNQALQEMERIKLNQERLSSLATLSAGAAHELSTPLSTIALVASELERQIQAGIYRSSDTQSMLEDSKLIAAEVKRCKSIINRMGAKGGDLAGEIPEEVTLDDLLGRVRSGLSAERSARLVTESSPEKTILPAVGVVQSLIAIVNNAFDASSTDQTVKLRAMYSGESTLFTVTDSGSGMDSATATRIAEPFFSTKPPGAGMGLGLFLVNLFSERVGASFDIVTEKSVGTTVTLSIPKLSLVRAA